MTTKFVARLVTFSTAEVLVPVMAESMTDAQREAEAAARALRSGQVECRVMGLDNEHGEALLRAPSDELPPGYTEVVWRKRYPTLDREEAVCLARIEQADPDSPMSFFETRVHGGPMKVIDLQQASNTLH